MRIMHYDVMHYEKVYCISIGTKFVMHTALRSRGMEIGKRSESPKIRKGFSYFLRDSLHKKSTQGGEKKVGRGYSTGSTCIHHDKV